MQDFNKEEKNTNIKWHILLLLLIFLVLGMAIGIGLVRGQRYAKSSLDAPVSTDRISGGVKLVVDSNAGTEQPGNTVLEQGVVITGRDSMTFSANTKEETVDFINPEENAQMYYLTFELRLYSGSGEDYEVLYTSGLVEPGKRIHSITLSRALEKGVYDAVIHVQPYRMNEQKTLTNNADMKIRLIVN